MEYPLVSVIIAAYNAEKYIYESINSILNQSYPNFELIIIDDGSTDDTGEIISSFEDSRIKSRYQQNSGQAKARNKGLKLSKGKYIAIQDADDISDDNRLAVQVSFLEKYPEVLAVGSSATVIDKDGDYVFTKKMPKIINNNHNWANSPFIHSSVMFRKIIVKRGISYPDLSASAAEDTGFFYRISEIGVLQNIESPLIKYRIHPDSISRKNKILKRLTTEILEEYFITGNVNEDKIEQIKKIKSKQSNQDRIYRYHLLLGKKYLWNNYKPRKSRENLKKAIELHENIICLEPIFLYGVTWLGENVVNNLYRTFKG